MSDLTDFLLARIAEDEAWAAKVGSYLKPYEQVDIHLSRTEGAVTTSEKAPAVTPARVLAECEAKRRIIDLSLHGCGDDYERVQRALAAVYADHPDFDPEWRA